MRPARTLSLALALLAFSILPLAAQDELPSTAKPDMPMENVDMFDLGLFRLSAAASTLTDNPAEELYKTWDTQGLFGYNGVTLPDTFNIDLTNYSMPTTNTKINDVFGYRPRRRRVHYGIDIKVEIGDTIRAAFDGKVRVRAFNRRGYGNYVVIRHENGLETLYGHLTRALVDVNDMVHAGDPIGLGGSTGRSTGSHLHFETRLLGTALNPSLMFDFPNQKATGESYRFSKKAAAKTAASSASYYKVRQGDTLSKIAARNGTTIKNICKLNRITQNSIIRPGQTLRIR